MSDEKRIIEINGVKIEVDLRTAKRVDSYRVGDRVKVLKKSYGETFESFHGVIVAFDEFIQRPAITICYVTNKYGSDTPLEFVTLTKDSKDIEIAPANGDVIVHKEDILATIDKMIEGKRAEIQTLEAKRNYFLARFGAWFESPASFATPAERANP